MCKEKEINKFADIVKNRLLALRRPFLNQKPYNLNQLQKFEAVLVHNGHSLKQFKSILDFACGYGRLTKYLFGLVPEANISGCDIQNDLVTLCNRKFPKGSFIRNEVAPPINFSNSQFDLIFSYSAFTHLSESNHAAWLKELARILMPGGVMLHTTHSFESLRRMAFFSPESLVKYNLPGNVDLFTSNPETFHYAVNDTFMPEYGVAIISKEYVINKWPDYSGLKLVDYVEGAIESYPEGCHDIAMLMKEV